MEGIRILTPNDVPVLSLKEYESGDPARRSAYLDRLRQSLDTLGFLVISNWLDAANPALPPVPCDAIGATSW